MRGMEPPDELKAMDPQSVEAVEWGLWCTLWQRCDKCQLELDFPDFSQPPWNGDACAWAKHFAPQVAAAGWRLDSDCFNLICPTCQTNPGRKAEG